MTLADCTVMVVEDHEFQRQTTLQMLANLGVGALLEAADGDSRARAARATSTSSSATSTCPGWTAWSSCATSPGRGPAPRS